MIKSKSKSNLIIKENDKNIYFEQHFNLIDDDLTDDVILKILHSILLIILTPKIFSIDLKTFLKNINFNNIIAEENECKIKFNLIITGIIAKTKNNHIIKKVSYEYYYNNIHYKYNISKFSIKMKVNNIKNKRYRQF